MYEVRCRKTEPASSKLHLSLAGPADDGTRDVFSCEAVGVLSSNASALEGKDCRVRVLMSPDWTADDVQVFGRYGLIEIADQNISSPEEGTAIFLCSGRFSGDAPDHNCILLSPNSHRELVSLLRHESVVTVQLSLAITRNDLTFVQSDRTKRILQWAKAIPLGAASFALPSAVFAQCDSPSSGNYDSGTNYSGVDVTHIIQSDEGGNATSGYIPNGSSGVTIAGGLDLGVNDASDLQKMGVPQNLINQFSPFLAPGPGQTVTGPAAQSALNSNPGAAQITSAQANQINQAVYNYKANAVAVAFNNASPNMMFTDLNVQWQTVMTSMYFQSPSIVNTQFFSQVANGQWSQAIGNLQNFNGPSSAQNNRAAKNANYLTSSGCTNGTSNGG